MAGDSIRISTDQVAEIADRMERLNIELESTLNESRSAVDSLKNIWTGEAAEETVTAYDSFAAAYFDRYREMIRSYVSFLRNNVSTGYTETENANAGLAEAFR